MYPIQSSQLDSLAMAGGLSPSPEHGTGSFRQLSNHVDPSEELEVNSTAVSDTSHLFIIFLVGVGKSDLVVEVEDSPQGKVGGLAFQELW